MLYDDNVAVHARLLFHRTAPCRRLRLKVEGQLGLSSTMKIRSKRFEAATLAESETDLKTDGQVRNVVPNGNTRHEGSINFPEIRFSEDVKKR